MRAIGRISSLRKGVTRRAFVGGASLAGAGLVIGVSLPGLARGQKRGMPLPGADADAFAPNAFVRIAPDDTVTVLVKHIEFGQGPYTGLATLVAEELDADWAQMRAVSAPADAELYKNFAFGIQGTGGSTAMPNSYLQMRRAGAAARAVLVAAAAERWQVPAGEIEIERGVLRHRASGRTSGFGALVEAARDIAPPSDPALKEPRDFRLIGTAVPKLDTAVKTDGSAEFTLDVYRPGMLTVLVAHPPVFGATVASVDAAAAKKVAGVRAVETLPQGVAVYGDNFWAAKKGRDALSVEWNEENAERRSSETLIAEYRETAEERGLVAEERGDADRGLERAATVHEAEYVFPFLAHAPMEPLDAVIEWDDGGATVWMGSQLQTVDQQAVAGVLGLAPETVAINTLYAGGSFGRRAQAAGDFAAEAAEAVKALGKGRPVKLVWTREDDVRGGRYRPLTVHRLKGGLDEDGRIVAWDQVVASQSILADTPFEGAIQSGIDPSVVEGAVGLPYAIPDFSVSMHAMKTGVPVLWWRSVGHTHTGYTTETFVDELLERGGRDPVEGRLAMLGEHPRHAGVLERAAEMADWGKRAPEGRARGVALHKSFDTYVAQIVEISEDGQGIPRVHKVWCAVDCGVPVNLNVITAQMEGGIGFGLGAALFDEIVLGDDGRVAQSNFHDYRSLRLPEMPDVEVSIIRSSASPTGVGEPGVPPVAPAVANAWRSLTGRSVRRLPFTHGSNRA